MVLLNSPAPTTIRCTFCTLHPAHCISEGGDAVDREAGPVVWVFQREFATASPEDGVAYIGSQFATTCLLVSLFDPATRTTSVAHLDGHETATTINAMVDSMLRGGGGGIGSAAAAGSSTEPSAAKAEGHTCAATTPIQVSMIGSYEDEKGESAEVLSGVLDSLMAHKLEFQIRASRLGRDNTTKGPEGFNRPVVSGCIVRIRDGEMFAACCEDEANTPMACVRNGRFLSQNAAVNVFDRESKCIRISKFSYRVVPDLLRLMNLSDRQLLDLLSTSPYAEGPTFCQKMRDSVRFLNKNSPAQVWPQSAPKFFHWTEGGGWIERK